MRDHVLLRAHGARGGLSKREEVWLFGKGTDSSGEQVSPKSEGVRMPSGGLGGRCHAFRNGVIIEMHCGGRRVGEKEGDY